MQLAGHLWTGFIDYAFAGQPFARLEYRGRREEHHMKIGIHLAANRLGAGPNVRKAGLEVFRSSADRGPSVAIRAGGLACLGPLAAMYIGMWLSRLMKWRSRCRNFISRGLPP